MYSVLHDLCGKQSYDKQTWSNKIRFNIYYLLLWNMNRAGALINFKSSIRIFLQTRIEHFGTQNKCSKCVSKETNSLKITVTIFF